jgi:hypothetical protein
MVMLKMYIRKLANKSTLENKKEFVKSLEKYHESVSRIFSKGGRLKLIEAESDLDEILASESPAAIMQLRKTAAEMDSPLRSRLKTTGAVIAGLGSLAMIIAGMKHAGILPHQVWIMGGICMLNISFALAALRASAATLNISIRHITSEILRPGEPS